MSINAVRMSRYRMMDLLDKLGKEVPFAEERTLYCFGGGSLILFDENFNDNVSTDIDVFLFEPETRVDPVLFDWIANVAEREPDKLQYDWINSEAVSYDASNDIKIEDFKKYINSSKKLVFPNLTNDGEITLYPVDFEIAIIAKVLSDRDKDVHFVDYDVRFIDVLTNIAKNFSTKEELFQLLDDMNYVYDRDRVEVLYDTPSRKTVQ